MKDIFNKRQRFSIRKFSVGVASVLIGIALFTPSQGVLASTENSLPSVEKREAVQPISDNQNNPSSELDTRDVPIGSTRTTEPVRSGDKENNSLTTRDFVAGEDRSSTPAVRATSNPSEVKKYELTDEYAKQIKAGVIGSEGNKLDSLLLNGPKLSPEAYTDEDYLKDKEELYIYEKDGKKYVGYNSHPMLEDTDGDGIIDSKEKPDEKLKWNVSERDMIMFMELSYRDDDYIDKVLNNKKQLTEADLYKKKGESKPRYEYMMMNRELAPYWKRKKSYHTSSGLDAVLYETKSDFLYLPNGTAQVLAFRGTSDAKDIVADGVLGVGSNPQQGNDAENIMRELAKDKSITNLYLTGHSLGGYLVQRAMVEAYQLAYSDSRVMSPKEQRAYRNFYNNVLKKGTTFNAPKVVTSWVSRREFWQKGLDSKKIAKSGKMTHYIVDNDSTIRKGVSNDSDVVINVGRTSGGHSSRSYFEADLINRRSEFMSGKRISLDGTGYQDKKITTVKSVEKFGETTVYSKSGDDIIKSTTVSMKDPDTGQITKNTLDEVFKKDGAKAKVVVTPLDPSVRYEKDATRAKEEAKVTVSGTPGTRTVTTTYTVNPTDGSLIPHEGKPVIKPSTPTVVKVPAKDEVEYLKEGDDVVKKTTTYAVNASTGVLTPTEKKEIFKQNGAKSKVVVTPIQPSVRYEKDATKAKGESKITVSGTPGTRTVTTTYTVNPTDGNLIPHEGKPVIKPSTPTVVKVPAKDEVEYLKEGDDVVKKTITYAVNVSTGALTPTEKNEVFKKDGAKSKVVVTPIHPSVRYEKDATKAKGEAKITVAGTPGTRTVTTTYTVNSTDGNLIPHEGKPVIKPSTPTVVRVPAKDEVEYLKEGDDVVKKTTTYAVNVSTGALTPTEKNEVFKKDGAKSKVVVTPIEPSIRYEKDATKAKGEAKITVAGTPGTRTVTTTYAVNSIDGSLIPHEEPAVVVPSKPTVVKVPAKDEVEYLKEGDDVVKKTTSYEVNASTGALTPTVRKDIASPNGVKSKVVTKIIPVTTRYEADKTKDVGTNTVTNNGSEGKIVTTTSTLVNETNGTVTDGTPIVSRTEMVPKVVKVGAKDKVVETPIEPEVEYVRDGEREVDTPNEHVEGAKGKTVTTTTYDVDPKDGHITEHVGNPVVTPACKTIVKVGAKTKVEQSKDSEGRDVIDTTTYEVDPKTGKVTPTTVRTYGTTKEPTTETRPVPSPVVYEKDDSRDKDLEPVRKEGTPGEDTITTTYTVDPNTGKITASEGQPVRTKEPTNTIVKVAAKDKVETTEIPSPKKYVKDDTRDKDQPNVEEAGRAGSRTTTTTYKVNPADGTITERVGEPVVVNPTETIVKVAAKDKVVETPIEPEVEYVRDVEKDFGTPAQRTEGEKGKTVTTTTYDVDPKDGHITEHVGNPVVTPAGKTIVKIGAKTKVEQSKDPEGRDVIDTTTYEVDPKTGNVTPTTVRTYGTSKEPTVELEQSPKTGDATVTPKKRDDSTSPSGTKVEMPGEDGKGKVPNSDLPEGKVTKPGQITEPDKPSVEVPEVTTPTGKTPKVELEQNPKTGDVTVTPKKTDSSTYQPGTKVEIPGENGEGKVTEPGKPSVEVPVENPPEVTIFENGVLPDSIELPELMIEVRWIDEAGNVLKPSVKTGNEKDAEHGSIPGYEFVRTVIDENEPVMTHIFRKVSGSTIPNTIPVTPVLPDINGNSGHDTAALTTPTPVASATHDANGNSGQDKPAPATPTPNAVQVDTKTTVDNGAKSNDSQNVLPNTGTESNASLASLGLLGLLSGFGLVARKKKED
ncbi:YSIRK signal domain/LPXTG anchor domain surface protein [Streptococcus oralis subsp. dentisani]|uniref:YSIRK signal domain/LPXTG anchor domain surface protein n=1 Tax=Streptococcus oralis subsp. dentisani TaxID=1458253 RepID=A0A2I1UDZ8_STROR|nr:G5 domain-containing protein [Streptococcus oralis]MDK7307126.1 G5 domain-containing protein [Streptococcus oralis]MDK7310612.1 G5 domain-containing protein [Streptococcus oralis]MDU3981478.1 G5 domain-containing protein [Streptococcus mitis]PLA04133.1 YSIRK signal domain/LPXTG anchor domain surface protein [Streptococcus oralis subsp. dentisani]